MDRAMTRPSLWRRLTQFFCPHGMWDGFRLLDNETHIATVCRCMNCGYTAVEWKLHRRMQ